MRILVIDPWGVNGPARYLNGLLYGLSNYENVTVITNKYFKKVTGARIEVHNVFFSRSEKMQSSKVRLLMRGFEYCNGYYYIFRHLRNSEKYDVIHINWLLVYRLDKLFLKILHKYCKKIVYTAHNVLPHVNSKGYIEKLRPIYSEVDKIVVHGERTKQEFIKFFPEDEDKIFVQYHGADLNTNLEFVESDVPNEIRKRMKQFKKKYLFVGQLFYNKGIDRLLPMWREMSKDALLTIVGKPEERYQNYYLQKKNNQLDNIMYLDHYV